LSAHFPFLAKRTQMGFEAWCDREDDCRFEGGETMPAD
jgi:arginine deiminase